MATRLANPNQNSKPKITPTLDHEWIKLLKEALAQAERTNDPRAAGLRRGLAKGQAERTLRRLNLVCPADLRREFPG